jgi:hypothetical protein
MCLLSIELDDRWLHVVVDFFPPTVAAETRRVCFDFLRSTPEVPDQKMGGGKKRHKSNPSPWSPPCRLMAEKTREEKFVRSSTAQRERLEWDENRKIVQNVFSMDSMDWENLYSLQRHRKIPVGSLIQHDDPFFLNRKQEERNPHRKTHVFITREHHIHRYCVCVCVCIAVLLSSKDGL